MAHPPGAIMHNAKAYNGSVKGTDLQQDKSLFTKPLQGSK